MALGALIIKEKLGISDRETVEQIKENHGLDAVAHGGNHGSAASLFTIFYRPNKV